VRYRVILTIFFFCVCVCALTGAGGGTAGSKAPLDGIPVYDYVVVNEYPHDSDAYTQGLYYKDGYLYEGTGAYGQSTLRKVIPETGNVVKIHHLPGTYFGEGITVRNDTIHQLTYHNYVALTYVELDTFALVDSFPYAFAGWGLTHDDTSLISSDGTSRLFHLNPQTYEEIRRFIVTADGVNLSALNEMELIQGRIWANIYGKDSVAVIVPETGVVESWINLAGLRDSISWGGVLNGIAFDSENFRLFVTGKRWPTMFEVWVDAVNYPPEIIGSSPPPSMCLEIDSTVVLSVSAEDPNYEEVLDYTWSINSVIDPVAHDSVYVYSSPVPAVDTVRVRVSDGMFSDSTSWLIVVETAGAGENPDEAGIGALRPPRIQPNPFSRETTIRFSVPGSSGAARRVDVAIYDIRGRRMRNLVSSELEPGDHEVLWNGTDSRGGRVSAGIYLCTLEVGGRTVSRKLAVLE
jgi:glutamine cyclotransferase